MILINKLKFNSEEMVLVECDFNVSHKCKHQYLKMYKCIIKNRLNNNGKDKCIACFNTMTKTGKNNFNYKYNKNEDFFNTIDTELKAYLLGWIAGDGHIKKEGFKLEIHIMDIEILQLFKMNICSNLNIKISKRLYKNRISQTALLDINSTKMSLDLLKHLNLKSSGKKCDKISLPNLNEELMWHFIRGLIDSDGSITSPFGKHTNPRCGYCSISPIIKPQIMNFCAQFGIKSYIDNYSLCFGGLNAIMFMKKLYENSQYSLTRKRCAFLFWNTWTPNQGTIVRPRKIRTYYPPMSEQQKESIRSSNKKRKGKKLGKPRKDKGVPRGPNNISEDGRNRIKQSNAKRKGIRYGS